MDSSDSDEDEEIVSRRYKRAAWCIVLLGLLVTLGGLPQAEVSKSEPRNKCCNLVVVNSYSIAVLSR